jgi:hypothetical protein
VTSHNCGSGHVMCFLCGLRHATLEEIVFSVWCVPRNNRGAVFLCGPVRGYITRAVSGRTRKTLELGVEKGQKNGNTTAYKGMRLDLSSEVPRERQCGQKNN